MKKLFSLIVLVVSFSSSYAQIAVPFNQRYENTVKGGIVFVTNAIIECNGGGSGGANCGNLATQTPPTSAGWSQNNDHNTSYIDIDSDATTFSSSADSLNLPLCSEILFAEIYWGARRQTFDANYGTRNQLKIAIDGGAYTTVMADTLVDNTTGYVSYHCRANVTSLIQSAGLNSKITVADVYADLGRNRFGGWNIVVVYKNDLLTQRNITVYDGIANVSGSTNVDIPVAGFLTPPTGVVNFDVGVFAYDGDRGFTGDALQFDGGSGFVGISNSTNPTNDIFNFSITDKNVVSTSQDPLLENNISIDADIFAPDNSTQNYIGNSATSATVRVTTGGETILSQVVTLSIDVYEPDIRSSVSVVDLNGGVAEQGDTLEYTVKAINIGSDPSNNTFVTDTIEGNGFFVPGSIEVLQGPNVGVKTDAVGDDQAEYDGPTKTIKVRIGSGANAASGGTVLNSPNGADSTIFKFRVVTTDNCIALACDPVLDNQAFIFGTGPTSGNQISNGSNPGTFDANGCPIPGTTSTPINAATCSLPNDTTVSTYCSEVSFSDFPYVGYSYFDNTFTPVTTASSVGIYYAIITAYAGCDDTVQINILSIISCDADGDGVSDIQEASDGTNPFDSCSFLAASITLPVSSTGDCDGDGVSNIQEGLDGTDGNDPCSFVLANANSTPSAAWNAADCDGDGVTNGQEVTDGTDPLDICSFLGATTPPTATVSTQPTCSTPTGTITVTSPTPVAGITYTVTGTNPLVTSVTNATGVFSGLSAGDYDVITTSGAGCVSLATALTVDSINCPPSQGNETLTVTEDDPLTNTGDLTANNTDPDGTPTSLNAIVSSTGGGTVTINGNSIDYTPAPNFNGIDTIIYEACDAGLPLPAVCVNDTIFITVDPVNDASSQGNETLTVNEDDLTATTSVDLTINNIDPDGTTTSVTNIISNTGGGTVTDNGDGTIDYIPAPNFNGVDTVIYEVCDAGLPLPRICVNDTLFVTVNPVNDPPSQGNETLTVTEDDPLTNTGDLTTNNTDPDGTPTSLNAIVSSTGGGTVTINGNSIDYTPAPDFNGIDTVIYEVCDAGLPLPAACVNDTLFITVDPVNDTPSQGSETLTINEDDPLTNTGDLTANNTDPDGTPTSLNSIVSSTGGGTVTINGNSIDYTPAPDFNSVDTIIYEVCDQGLPLPTACVNDTLFITVDPVNDAPSQGNEALTVTEDDPLTNTGDLTANNTDPDGTPTSLNAIVSSTGGGTVTINGNSIDYTPAPDFNGIDTVIYEVCDAGLPLPGVCINDTLFITVDPVNDAPSQGNETLTVGEDDLTATTSIDLTINNIDPDGTTTSVTNIISNTGGGTVTDNGDGTIDYIPAPNFNGVDTVIYEVCDAGLPLPRICVNDTLFVAVNPVNDPPSQGNETLTVTEDNPLTNTGDLTANNTDPDGTPTSLNAIVSSTGGGTVTINGNSIDYTPAANFNGIDTVIYEVCDAGLPLPAACVNDTLFITVDPVNDTPSQGNETLTVGEDDLTATTSIDLTINNIDPDGTTTSVTNIISNTGGGTVTDNGDGTIDYTPAPNFTGVDTVIYEVCDAGLPLPAACVNDTLFVNVIPVNDPPSHGNEALTITEDDPLTNSGDLTTNNIDPDGTPTILTSIVSSTGGGTLTINGNSIDYTPAPDFNGVDTIIYEVCDQGLPLPGVCINDTLFITVDPVNDTPSQGNETLTVGEDDLTATTSIDLTINNIDPDGTTTSVTNIISNTGGGTVTDNGDGTIDYTPAPNFTGVDTVIYEVCDTGLPTPVLCVNDTLFVNVIPINDPPSQGNEALTITEDDPLTNSGDLTTNNIDPDGTPTILTSIVSSTGGGTLTINGNSIDYTPAPDFNGIDTVIYEVCDQGLPLPGVCINDTLFITVDPVNDAPIIDNENIITAFNTPIGGDLTDIGDVDPDGTVLIVNNTTPVSGPVNGSITVNSDGTYNYIPNTGFSGLDTVVVEVCDQGLPLPAICINDTIFITVNPCDINDPLADCDGDGVSNGQEVTDGTDPLDDCSFTSASIILTVTSLNDCDGDGVTNAQEALDGTDLRDSCSFVLINATLAPSVAWNDADCDGDGITNGQEVIDGTDPLDDCSFTLTSATLTPSTAWNDADCDGDGVTNGQEVIDGTNPLDDCDYTSASITLTVSSVNDCDGDGVTNAQEALDGTDGNDPCSFTLASSTLTPSIAWNDADCDGDGVTNGQEVIDGTNPLDDCDYTSASITLTVSSVNDCDGDGVTNAQEALDGTDGNDPCSFTLASSTLTPSTAWNDADCDGDGVKNGQEVIDGTDPSDDCDYTAASITLTVTSLNDCDGDGVTNAQEALDGTDGNDPCSFTLASATLTPSTAWNDADCDGDGVTNGQEVIDGTDPSDDCDYTSASITLTVSSVNDCDGDGVTNAQEALDGTDGNDPCSFTLASSTLTPSTAWNDADCDGDGVKNGQEVIDGTDPSDDCDYTAASITLTVTSLNDCDGDGVTNAQEALDGTDGNDPCSFILANATLPASAAWNDLDCDGDGVTNGQELIDGTNPLDDCDFTAASITLTVTSLNDCDGDGVTNAQEALDGTDSNDPCSFTLLSAILTPSAAWNDLDCDGDGVTNGQEVIDGTDPSDDCDYLLSSQTLTPSAQWLAGDCDNDGILNGDDNDVEGVDIPEGFSPNGDNINDFFEIKGISNFSNASLVIFNRWGNKVFSSSNGYANDWDGSNQFGITAGTRDLPEGTYFYILDLGDDSEVVRGYIYLKR